MTWSYDMNPAMRQSVPQVQNLNAAPSDWLCRYLESFYILVISTRNNDDLLPTSDCIHQIPPFMWFYLIMGTLFSIYAIDLLWLVLVAMTARSQEVDKCGWVFWEKNTLNSHSHHEPCKPLESSSPQAIRLYRQYLQDHPEEGSSCLPRACGLTGSGKSRWLPGG